MVGHEELVCVVVLVNGGGENSAGKSVCHGLITYRSSGVVVYTRTHYY